MSSFLKSSAVRDAALEALARRLTLARTVWVNAGGDFTGALNDTITVRVPAYTTANTRAMRSGASRTRRGLFESSVPVTLDTNLYRDVPLTDEEQTLDIMNFARQIMNPMLTGIARGIEDTLVADAIMDASYEWEVTIDPSRPYGAIVQASKHLDDSNVPPDDRFLVVGSSVKAALQESPQFARADQSGTTQTLRQGVIGDVAGFEVLASPAIPPDEAYAYHRTAFVLATKAPIVPRGAPAGFSAAQDGFAIRVVEVLDSQTLENIVACDVFVGASPVTDYGFIGADGRFTPDESVNGSFHSRLFVRGVKLTLDAGSS